MAVRLVIALSFALPLMCAGARISRDALKKAKEKALKLPMPMHPGMVPHGMMQQPGGCVSAMLSPATTPRPRLIPEMVFPYLTNWINNEQTALVELNQYVFSLQGIQANGAFQPCQQPLLKFEGDFFSNKFGHQRMKAYDIRTGTELFQVRRTRSRINPVNLIGRETYRILAPGEDDASWTPLGKSNKVLYTLNRDYFGRGFGWKKPEWRIYKGHKGDAPGDSNMLYYCLGTVHPWSWHLKKGKASCWHTREEHDGNVPPVFKMEQVMDAGALFGGEGAATYIPDNFMLHIGPNEDAAVLLVFNAIWDMINDTNGGSEGVINTDRRD